jgi:hypothetical protein
MDSVFECAAVETSDKNNDYGFKLIIVVVYRAPDSDIGLFFKYFEQLLYRICSDLYGKRVLICGDFNINILERNSNSLRLLGLMESVGLSAVFNSPTRITCHSSTCIDNIFTNYCPSSYHGRIVEFGLSDHTSQVLYTTSKSVENPKCTFYKKRVYSPANIEEFCRLLSKETWESCLNDFTCNGSFNRFFTTFNNCFNAAFPNKKNKSVNSPSRRTQEWITVGLRISCKNKRNLFELSKIIPDPSFQNYFKNYKKVLQRTISAAKKMHNSDMIKRSTNVAQTSWKIVRSELGKERVCEKCPKIMVNGSLLDKPEVVANYLNDRFVSVGTGANEMSSLREAGNFNKKKLHFDSR